MRSFNYFQNIKIYVKIWEIAAVTELADVHDSKSCEGNLMGVQLSPAAPRQN